jgi:MFS family permease
MSVIDCDLKPPIGLRWRSSSFLIVATVAIGMFTDLFLYGLIVPVLPFILRDRVGIPHSEIQYYTSLLLACFAGSSVLFSLPAGIIADKLPTRQLPFLVGLMSLLLSTLMLSLGRTIPLLVAARILQGVSAAVVWTVGMALVMDTVGSEKLGATIGNIFSFISIGELLAPVLGGVVYQTAGSTAIFGMGFALLAVDFTMRIILVEKKTAAKYGLVHTLEEEGADQNIEEANERDALLGQKDDPDRWIFKKDLPRWAKTFPLVYCLKDSRLLTAQVFSFIQASIIATFDSTIPTEAQDLFGFDSLKAGLLFVPLITPYLILGPISGRAVDKYGVKPSAVIGMAYIALPLLALRIPSSGGSAEIIKFATILMFCGIGLALISAPSLVESSNVVAEYHKANKDFFGEQGPYAQLYAINSIFFSLGLTLGPLVAGALRERIGYGNMNAVVAGLALLTSALSFVFLGGTPQVLKRSS